MSGLPTISIPLTYSGGTIDLFPFVTQDVSTEILERIEDPGIANKFSAAECQIAGFDVSDAATIANILASTAPGDTSLRVLIIVNMEVLFSGFVETRSVIINSAKRSWSFTAISNAALLARTDATELFKRNVSGWYVSQQLTDPSAVVVSKAGNPDMEFFVGDTIGISFGGDVRESKILRIAPNSVTQPYTSWFMFCAPPFPQLPQLGSEILLISLYRRNVPLREAVDALFVKAGLPATVGANYSVTAPSGAFFASAANITGLPGVPESIVASYNGPHNPLANPPTVQTQAACGTSDGLYVQTTPPVSAWQAIFPNNPLVKPVDWKNQGTGAYVLYGKRQVLSHPRFDGVGFSWTFAYDYRQPFLPFPQKRYRFECVYTPFDAVSWDVIFGIYREEATNSYQWTQVATVWTGVLINTQTDPLSIREFLGIDLGYDGVLYFTEPFLGGDGVHLGFRLSSIDPTLGGIPSPVVSEATEDVLGFVFAHSQGYITLCETHEFKGNTPRIRIFNLFPFFAEILPNGQHGSPIPKDFIPWTLKPNDGLIATTGAFAGPQFWGISASEELGVRLHTFSGPLLFTFDESIQIAPPGPIQGNNLGQRFFDLAIVRDITRPIGGGIPWPGMAVFGNLLFWIDSKFSGYVAEMNTSGLSCGDVLAQLATIVNAFYYVDANNQTYFKTRDLALGTIATAGNPSDVLDDVERLADSFEAQPVWERAALSVTVNNDLTNVSASSGAASFGDKSLNMQITNRYVDSESFASAIAKNMANYFKRQLAGIRIMHPNDGRSYQLGKTFKATYKGTQRTFQITEVQRFVYSPIIVITAVEL